MATSEATAVHDAIARVRAGDRDALRVLYAGYSDVVRRYATTLLRDRDLAEDVTQTTFLKLISALHRYERREAPFEAWLLRVARNVALDMARQRRAQVDSDWLDERADGGADDHTADDRRALTEALAALPAPQREVIVLRHVVGLSTSEIAARLDRTETAVNNLHHRARATLRVALQAGGATPHIKCRSKPANAQGHAVGRQEPIAPRPRSSRFSRRAAWRPVIDITD